jgi:exopolysaccharide production protein ExoQ
LRMVLTYVLLIPLLFFAVHGGLFSFQYAAGMGGVDSQWGSLAGISSDPPEHQAETLLVVGLLFCITLMHWRGLLQNLRQIGIFCFLTVFAMASTLWSQDPSASLRNSVFLGLNTLFALFLIKRFTPNQQMRLIMLLGTITAFLSIALALGAPKYGVAQTNGVFSWQGIFAQKNNMGEAMAFFLTPAFFVESTTVKQSIYRKAYIVLILFLIGMSGSRTAWLITFLLLLIVGIMKIARKFKKRDALVLTLAVTVIAAACALAVSAYLTQGFALLGKDATLTGRTDIWKAVLLSIAKRPLFGYGYAAFWEGFRGESAHVVVAAHWMVTYAHNGFLEVGLELGIVGIVLVVWTLFATFRNAAISLRPRCPEYVLWYLSIAFLMLLYNMDEARFIYPNAIEWVMYVMASAALWQEARSVQNKKIETASKELVAV